ncbi:MULTISPECIES: hypothetical protein [unclassified Bradyrhizobium]|uniref:hypothetical protein n=1 Tax=unclassified Bradyrhizobium TaxID=2631580 RepID=UPI001FF72D6D|nr:MULTISPECIES: hypothetical protein [unclassified Bradyrhizobium]MCK1466622.1 hypothetical protein [Bradyrhizobium sp. CW10]MCK1499181.1 hypothetical protein [Bradyrhizobium sp. 188]
MLAEHTTRADRFEPMDHIRLFTRQWRWIAATFVIVSLLTIVPLSRVKPQWEAQATIRIGQVYDALAVASRPIEPLQEVLERMRVTSQQAGLESTRTESIPGTGLIRITARDSSSEKAIRLVATPVDHLRSVHGELARAARSEADLLAEEYREELAGLREVQASLQKAFSSATGPGANEAQAALAAIAPAMEKNAKEIAEVMRQRFLLIRRNGFQSAPTEMMGEVSSVRIASTSKGLVVFFGTIVGLAAGLIVGLLRDHVVRIRSQPLSP